MSEPNLSAFIWSVADLLRGDYKPHEYGKVILPFTVLRRLDCVLEPTKPAVLAELEKRTKQGVNPEPFLLQKAGLQFVNGSPLDMKRLMGDQDHIRENLMAYVQAFSPSVRDVFATDEYRILLVANKYQTGFDQPLLCGMYVDRRLAGIQAVQTLSRLNRAYPGKDTTYVVDFANNAEEVLDAFRVYYDTAELTATTDPHLVYDLRAKLDALGYYDDAEVERVVRVELDPRATQAGLFAALEPVADRLMRRYRAEREAARDATLAGNVSAREAADEAMRALLLFRSDMAAYVRLYTFLSQIFDFGNTEIEKRAIFYRHLIRLLDFGREREGIDLSKVVLTHHTLKGRGVQSMSLSYGERTKLEPMTGAGSGVVHERQRVPFSEIIARVNDLFDGELTDQDKLVYVNDVLKGKLLESETLRQQAASNTKEQFASSPDLQRELMRAIMDALDAPEEPSFPFVGWERREAAPEPGGEFVLRHLFRGHREHRLDHFRVRP